jgi:hypothetical protein
MFNSFDYHGTGGIVANMSSDMSIPCIIYVLPLIPLLNECKKYNRKFLNFHILGGANFRDVMYYELFRMVVKKYHDIDLNITYDSSGIYKQVMHARFIYVPDEFSNLVKMSIKQGNLDKRFKGDFLVYQKYQDILDDLANKWNFKNISLDGVYDPNTKTFYEDVKVYSILYILNMYSEIQEWMRSFAREVFEIYEAGEMEEFYNECFRVTQIFNQGNLTKKQRVKSYSIPRSLEMLKDLDEDRCKQLVNKCLAKDEFINLDETTEVLKTL